MTLNCLRFPHLIALIAVACFATTAVAGTVLEDDFDDGTLDPAWVVGFNGASGWTHTEAGTNLTASAIVPTVVYPAWSYVTLSRSVAATGDFDLDFDMSWTSGSPDSNQPMQLLYLQLLDAGSNVVAQIGYRDAWVAARGGLYADLGGTVYSPGSNTQPYAGAASFSVNRTGSALSAYVGATQVATGTNSASITQVQMQFAYNAYTGGGGPSFFATESVDLVSLRDSASASTVPLPSAGLLGMTMLGLGLAMRMRRRLRR